MHRLFALLAIVALVAGFGLPGAHAGQPALPDRPNILFILADDLGAMDLGCYGSRFYRTPSIDRLRDQGMKFTQAYSCGPNCAPTRAALMSGLYGPRTGVYTVDTGARGSEDRRRLIPVANKTVLAPEFPTLAESLRAAGYATGHFGKWHLGNGERARPSARGFDVDVQRSQEGSEDKFSGELVDHAIKFIEERRDRPFYVDLAFYAVHVPIRARPETTARYKDRKPVEGQGNAEYAAMLEDMDASIGRLLARLDALNLSRRTLVIFTSDNGGVGGYRDSGIPGARDITSNAPLHGGKGMLYEGGIRVPLIIRWPGVVRPDSKCDVPVATVDFFPTLATIAGAKTPERMDGVSLRPLFRDPEASLKREALFWHFPGYLEGGQGWRTTPAGAIRMGDWKLIEFFEDGKLELYNLEQDPGERRNLAADRPARRDQLLARLRQWRESVGAPMPRPKAQGSS